MYTAHFGLAEPPFSVTPDPRYLYMSEGHREALAHLLYGIGVGGGFVQLTGEVGTGKTTLCRCLLEQLPPEVDVAFILNPRVTDVELLAAVCDELQIPYPAGTTSRKLYVDALHHHLLDAHGRGRRTVLIVDEAQDLAPEVLEQIRLLTNLETSTRKLLQIILIGQPELIRLLDRQDLRQLAQRVTARYHLLPFRVDDTRAYVRHRLEVAGRKEPLFTEAAMRRVHHAARGIPRLINAICDRALLGAYTRDRQRVGPATVSRAAAEVLGQAPSARRTRSWGQWAGAAVVVGALIAGASVLFTHGQIRLSPGGGPQIATTAPTQPAGPPGEAKPAPDPAAAAAAASPVEEMSAPPGVTSTAPRPVGLGELLQDPALRGDKKSAFASLYSRWQIDFDASTHGLACERGRPQGLQCLFKTGTWAQLRRFNLPAIIELWTPTGDRRYATVVAVDGQTATLDFGGQRHAFPLTEVGLYWEGAFILLWNAPRLTSIPVAPGARGKDVEWVRARLSEIDGAPLGGRNRDVFDEELRARVIAFQRARSLATDGIVGEETLTHLVGAQRDPAVPRLWRSGS